MQMCVHSHACVAAHAPIVTCDNGDERNCTELGGGDGNNDNKFPTSDKSGIARDCTSVIDVQTFKKMKTEHARQQRLAIGMCSQP